MFCENQRWWRQFQWWTGALPPNIIYPVSILVCLKPWYQLCFFIGPPNQNSNMNLMFLCWKTPAWIKMSGFFTVVEENFLNSVVPNVLTTNLRRLPFKLAEVTYHHFCFLTSWDVMQHKKNIFDICHLAQLKRERLLCQIRG